LRLVFVESASLCSENFGFADSLFVVRVGTIDYNRVQIAWIGVGVAEGLELDFKKMELFVLDDFVDWNRGWHDYERHHQADGSGF
jgi:hypothetical protein